MPRETIIGHWCYIPTLGNEEGPKGSFDGKDGGAEGSWAKPTIFRSARPAARRREGGPPEKSLRQEDAGVPAGAEHFGGPDGGLDLADVGLTEKEHTEAGLTYAAADGLRQPALQ